METSSSFGYWLRRQRKALDLTQQALADRVVCSLATIKKIEADERRPSAQIAERLAVVLAVPTEKHAAFLECARGLRSPDSLELSRQPLAAVAAVQRPTGAVTFLFSDIEGSTRLWQDHLQEMQRAQARHDEVLRRGIETHQGYVFQLQGDSFGAAFQSAQDALAAARQLQLDLEAEDWGNTVIRVRVGIHTGQAELQDDGSYSGYVTVSHVQRLMSAGHGGQVLVSSSTRLLLEEDLPDGMGLRDLGQRRLKDLDRPDRIYQLTAPGLRSDFPPLRVPDVKIDNLPVQLTSFIGRQQELAEVKELLAGSRLLTLTGTGGTGKTRLALQVAQDTLPGFADGAWIVELAPLTNPALIPHTIASLFDLREAPGISIADILVNYLRTRQLLLMLDNCEHLLSACARVAADLLHHCPQLKILVSSREALGITGETVYRVPSLSLPPPAHMTRDELLKSEAAQLLLERTRSVQPHLLLQESDVPLIAQICARLDGIPLALELAAARMAVFSAQEIASRLDDRFRLLTGGSQAALERHQTLRALIDWSYDLLSDEAQQLFRRLSVFGDGWTFDAAEALFPELDVLDLLTQLVNKSLVMTEHAGQATRYKLPETIREYARDKLLTAEEAQAARDRHLEFFLGLAEQAEPLLRGHEQLAWLERLEAEHDNLRLALSWSLESRKTEQALRLAAGLYYLWGLRGYWSEGRHWLDAALALSDSERAGARDADANPEELARRARALYAAAWMHMLTMGVPSSRKLAEESLAISRQLGDKWWTAVALEHLGLLVASEGDYVTARALVSEGLELARQTGDPWPIAACLVRLGDSVKGKDLHAARAYLEEGIAIGRRAGDRSVLSEGLRELGSVYTGLGELEYAMRVAGQALSESRLLGSLVQEFLALFQLVVIACMQKDVQAAQAYCAEILGLSRKHGNPLVGLLSLLAFGLTAIAADQPERGVRLLAASQALALKYGAKIDTEGEPLTIVFRQALLTAQNQLEPSHFERALREGRELSLDEAVALAEQSIIEGPSPSTADTSRAAS